jgi:aminopeptidase
MDSRTVEWARSARLAVEVCTRLRPDEEAVVVTDTKIREFKGARELVDAVFAAARAVGSQVTLVEFSPSRDQPNAELPDAVAAAMRAAKVVYTLPSRPPSHTQATRQARDAGARVLMLASGTSIGDDDVLYRLAPRSEAEIDEWDRLTGKLRKMFEGGGTLHATTHKGTDITCELGELEVHTMDAICRMPGTLSHFIAGIAGGGPNPGRTNGRLVVDAGITPIWRPLTNEEPVVLHVKDGYCVGVEGGPAAAEWKQAADALDDPTAYNVAEYGVGCHPRALFPHGMPMEDERLYGGFHLGFGSSSAFGGKVQSKWHIDASCTKATVSLNGELFLEDGVYRV